jgi:peptidyl-prolyl cis-trans isomerase A (cyclophilin A)
MAARRLAAFPDSCRPFVRCIERDMRALLPVLLASLALATFACSKSEPEPSGTAPVASSPPAGAVPTAATAAALAPTSSAPLAHVTHPDLLDPAKATAKAPEVYKAKFTTTKGDFVVEVHRDWSPNGADRFYNLVSSGFYDDTRFFRVVDGFMVQWGISGDPQVSTKWQNAGIPDDPVKGSNTRGMMTYAMSGAPNSRTTQVFINLVDNARLDAMRFAPFAKVVTGMEVVDQLYKGYGEGAPGGAGPNQGQIQAQGNAYLDAKFPRLDGVKHAEIVK